MSWRARSRRLSFFVLCGLLAVLALGGCSDDGGTRGESHDDAPPGPVVQVSIDDASFLPGEVIIPAGGSVQWTNVSAIEQHNLLALNKDSFAEHKAFLKPGESVTIRFTQPGDYVYWCDRHGSATAGQRGVVHVSG